MVPTIAELRTSFINDGKISIQSDGAFYTDVYFSVRIARIDHYKTKIPPSTTQQDFIDQIRTMLLGQDLKITALEHKIGELKLIEKEYLKLKDAISCLLKHGST